MTRFIAIALLLAAPIAAPSAQSKDGWTTLLDGTSLRGWNMVGAAEWMLTDGGVGAQSGKGGAQAGNGFLVSAAAYGDFELALDVYVSRDANSGVFIRCEDPKTITAANAYEVNVYDLRPDQTYRTGAIVDVAKPMVQVNAGDRWNTLEITARGPKLTVTLNGTRTVDVEDKAHTRGAIALQYSGGSVKFRNVRIRPL
jgi:hypothetical protein